MSNNYELSRNFGINLEIERMRLGLSMQQFADKLSVSLSTYRRMIDGSTDKISLSTIEKIYRLTGKYAFELCSVNDSNTEIVTKIRSLSEQQRIYIRAIIEFEHQFMLEYDDYEDYVTVFIPTGDMQDGMIYDSSTFEKVNIASYRKKFGNKISYGIKVTSNHLIPAYHLGDILLVAKEPIRDGDTGLFLSRETGRAYIRKFKQGEPCRLIPINDFGETFIVDPNDSNEMDKWVKFGRILTKVR